MPARGAGGAPGALIDRFRNAWFRFDHLHGEERRLGAYAAYACATPDDSPLAVYDSQFGEPPENDDEGDVADDEGVEGDGADPGQRARNALAREYAVPPLSSLRHSERSGVISSISRLSAAAASSPRCPSVGAPVGNLCIQVIHFHEMLLIRRVTE